MDFIKSILEKIIVMIVIAAILIGVGFYVKNKMAQPKITTESVMMKNL